MKCIDMKPMFLKYIIPIINQIIYHKEKLNLMLIAFMQVLISFSSILIVVKKIGFGDELDVFFLAMAVFGFLTTSISWSISSVLTTILINNNEDELEGKMFINVLLITFAILIITLASMPFWVDIIFINYIDVIGYHKIITLQTLLIIAFSISNLNIVLIAILQKNNQYIRINILNMLSAVVGFFIVFLCIEKFEVYAAAFSQLGIQIFLFAVMLFPALKKRKLNLTFNKKSFNLLWKKIRYVLIGSCYYRTDELVERFIASYLSVGFLSLVGFIQKVYGAIVTVLNTSISGPTITKFSYLVKNNEIKKIKFYLYKYLLLLFTINLFLFTLVILVGEDLFLYFFSKKIDNSMLDILFITLLTSFAMVIGSTLGQVLHNLLLSMELEKELTIYDSITFTINLILKVTATALFGINGFLLAIVSSYLLKNIVKARLLIVSMRKFNRT